MMKILCSFLMLAFTTSSAYAGGGHACAETRQQRYKYNTAKVAIASPFLELYDVIHLKLDLQMSHLDNDISGSATTTVRVTDSGGLYKYVFELNDVLIIDSVKSGRARLSAYSIGTHLYAVDLAAGKALNDTFSVQVFYHGTTKNGTGFFTNGVNHNVLSTGTNITFTLSDPNLAKDWWPSKQLLTDKIDSADLWFTVPNAARAGSNGVLQGTTPVSASATRYEWKTKYPIEYYLISVAIAPYADHRQMLHFSGSTDSMPVQHFIYDTASFYPLYKSAVDSTPGIVDYFSTLYGRYPFWKEKYGHCTAPLSGGMEHQTMTTLGSYATPLIAHELGHQWWGDCVTYTSWRDIWLSEGWASYTEQLYVEHFRSAAAAQDYRTSVFNRVMAKPDGSVYVDDTSNTLRIFDSRLTYDKGAAVAHMLRYIAPSDIAFFNGLKTYQQQYAFKTATTADFKRIMEAAYGRPLDSFFRQWVYGQGYPTYSATWNQKGSDVFITLEQSTSLPASVAAFDVPVELKLTSPAGDTVVQVALSTTTKQLFRFNWNKAMSNVIIDPNDNIVNRANPVFKDEELNVATPVQDRIIVYPNPTGDSWHISGMIPGTAVTLYDAGGKLVWGQHEASATLTIDGKALPPGTYSLSLQHIKTGMVVTKVLRKR